MNISLLLWHRPLISPSSRFTCFGTFEFFTESSLSMMLSMLISIFLSILIQIYCLFTSALTQTQTNPNNPNTTKYIHQHTVFTHLYIHAFIRLLLLRINPDSSTIITIHHNPQIYIFIIQLLSYEILVT